MFPMVSGFFNTDFNYTNIFLHIQSEPAQLLHCLLIVAILQSTTIYRPISCYDYNCQQLLKIWDILLNYAGSSQDCKELIRALPDRSWQLLHIQMSRLHFSPVFCQASATLSLLYIVIVTNDSGRHWGFGVGTEVNLLHLGMWDIFPMLHMCLN